MSHWQSKFWAVIEHHRQLKFRWGAHDCVVFAASCFEARTGDSEIYSRIANKFGSWGSAGEALRAHGGDLNSCIAEFLGPSVPWVRLGMGDIALAIDDDGKQLVCVHDGTQFVAPGDVGLRSIPHRMIQHGWSSG